MVTLTLHYSYVPNFVNIGDCRKSSKDKVGHKTSNLTQKVTVTVDRGRLDLKFKRMLKAQLDSINHYLRHDRKVKVFVNGKLYNVTTKSNLDTSNVLTNILIQNKKKVTL
jgi:hypothetical protein